MDFASLMSAQISKGKDSSSPTTTTKNPTPSTESSKKYLQRAELEAQRQQAYLDSQAALQREREEKLHKKRKAEDEEATRKAERDEKRQRMAKKSKEDREKEEARKEAARRKRLGLPDLPSPSSTPNLSSGTPGPSQEDVPDPDLKAKLRSLNEPTHLFGETHSQRLSRYHTLTTPSSKPVLSSGPIPTTLSLVPESEMRVPPLFPSSPSSLSLLYRQLASYFTLLLREWSHSLSLRPDTIKQSSTGRTATSALAQCITSLTPLFRIFEAQSLDAALLSPLLEIVSAAQERRYVDANDGYLRLSIGKAAWPIGVTMVGIHERSAREKLGEGEGGRAHIMSDEGTRKWLQSIKRCLSFAQTRWPPEDVGQLMG